MILFVRPACAALPLLPRLCCPAARWRAVLAALGSGLGALPWDAMPLLCLLLRCPCELPPCLQAIAELQRRGVADAGLAPPPIECSAIEHVRGAAAGAAWLLASGRLRPAGAQEQLRDALQLRLHASGLHLMPHLPLLAPILPPQVRTLDGCTHAYSFWEGVPVEGKAAFGRLFAASRTMRSVAVVQRAIRCGRG